MKILHLMLACFYIDNYSYQENLLPKYHKKMGHDVEIIASLFTFDENGKGKWLPKRMSYINEYDIPVTRLEFSKIPFAKRIRRYIGLSKELNRVQPDIIFIHGVQFCDIDVVVKYLKKNKNKKIRVYADNHSDFSNSAKDWFSKHIQHEIMWRHCAQIIEPYVTRFYGVLPARVDFLKEVYRLPKEKIELLIMGADDDSVEVASNYQIKQDIRLKYGIAEDDFLIMYGGKTDNYKKQTLLLMDAVNLINNPKLKLIVFGSVIPELKEEIDKRCSDRVQYIGWVMAADSYKYFSACDIACFPGRHSVFWEQVAGQGKPMIVKYWDGTTHIDCGGNVIFLEQDSVDCLKTTIERVMNDNFIRMKKKAEANSYLFKYSEIAKKSIREKNEEYL